MALQNEQAITEESFEQMTVKKRDGRTVDFNGDCIHQAITKAFRADRGTPPEQDLDRFSEHEINDVTNEVVNTVLTSTEHEVGIEEIQDLVEIQLMQRGHYSVARRYIVYREDHARARQASEGEQS